MTRQHPRLTRRDWSNAAIAGVGTLAAFTGALLAVGIAVIL